MSFNYKGSSILPSQSLNNIDVAKVVQNATVPDYGIHDTVEFVALTAL